MLGRLPMEPWQCIAELVDNAIDGYTNSPNSGTYKVDIHLPSLEQLKSGRGEIIVKDYSHGMSKEKMLNSVKAGWSGNEGYDRLGLFGMGFNISTSKLGGKTTVYSARKSDESFEWIAVDPDAMILHQRTNPNEPFSAMDGNTSKSEMEMKQGTMIKIMSLKKEMVEPLISDKGKLRKKLGRIYSPLMKNKDIDIRIHHETSTDEGFPVQRWAHCTWQGDFKKMIKEWKSSDYKQVSTKQEIQISLGYDRYCNSCWVWFDEDSPPVEDSICPYCKDIDTTVTREREIKGWLGVQRFFSGSTDSPKNHYGIDLVRNGRVIEELNKEFFEMQLPDGDEKRVDYPVEGNFKGRIVGSLEINFCPTEPEKSKFERRDPNWVKMMKAMRGFGLRPQVTEEAHGEFVSTKLSDIVRAWGSAKTQTGYSPYKQLIPAKIQLERDGKPKIDPKSKLPFQKADFKTPLDYAKKYNKGIKEYIDDEIWLKDIYESDEFDPKNYLEKWNKDNGIEDKSNTISSKIGSSSTGKNKKDEPKIPENWISDAKLSGDYKIDSNNATISVKCYIDDTEENDSKPMKVEKVKGHEYMVTYSKNHPIFSSFKEEPIDILMLELASSFYRINNFKIPINQIYLELKEKYCKYQKLDSKSVLDLANNFLEKLRLEITTWKLDGTKQDKDTIEFINSHFIRNHKDIEEANKCLKSGHFVKLIPSSKLFENILISQIPRLCDGKFFTADLQNASAASKNYLLSDIQSCLRQICYIETRAKKQLSYIDLQSVQNDVKRLRGMMVK